MTSNVEVGDTVTTAGGAEVVGPGITAMADGVAVGGGADAEVGVADWDDGPGVVRAVVGASVVGVAEIGEADGVAPTDGWVGWTVALGLTVAVGARVGEAVGLIVGLGLAVGDAVGDGTGVPSANTASVETVVAGMVTLHCADAPAQAPVQR